MINKYTVTDNTSLYRDGHSKAIINTDVSALSEYRQKMKMVDDVIEQKEELNTVKSEINNIRNDISELKQLMLALLNKV